MKKKKRKANEIKTVILPWSTEVDVQDYVNKGGSYRSISLHAHGLKDLGHVNVSDVETLHPVSSENKEEFSCREICIDYMDRLGNRQMIDVKLFS